MVAAISPLVGDRQTLSHRWPPRDQNDHNGASLEHFESNCGALRAVSLKTFAVRERRRQDQAGAGVKNAEDIPGEPSRLNNK